MRWARVRAWGVAPRWLPLLLVLSAALAITALTPQPAVATDSRFVVYTRTFHDAPFVDLWVKWYHMLGFYIVMLNTGPRQMHPLVKRAYDRIQQMPRVKMHMVPNAGNDALGEHLHLATGLPGVEWVLMVDMDEFLVLDRPTIQQHVDHLELKYGRLDAVQFRWAMMESVERGCPTQDLGSLVRESPIKPWTYLKTLTRADEIASVPSPHYPLLHSQYVPRARVLCDGFMFSGEQPAINRTIMWLPYGQSALLHLRTRSLIDMLVKAINTRLKKKPLRSKESLSTVLRAEHVENKLDMARLLKRFVSAVGIKAMQPIRTACDDRARTASHTVANFTVRGMRKRLYRLLAIQEARMEALGHAKLPMCDQWLEYRVFVAETLGKVGVNEEAFLRAAHFLTTAFKANMETHKGEGCEHVQLAHVGVKPKINPGLKHTHKSTSGHWHHRRLRAHGSAHEHTGQGKGFLLPATTASPLTVSTPDSLVSTSSSPASTADSLVPVRHP